MKIAVTALNNAPNNQLLLAFFNKKRDNYTHNGKQIVEYESKVKEILGKYDANSEDMPRVMRLMEDRNEELCRLVDRAALEKIYLKLESAKDWYMGFVEEYIKLSFERVKPSDVDAAYEKQMNRGYGRRLDKGQIYAYFAKEEFVGVLKEKRQLPKTERPLITGQFIEVCEELTITHKESGIKGLYEIVGLNQYIEKVYSEHNGMPFGIRNGMEDNALEIGEMLWLYGSEMKEDDGVYWLGKFCNESGRVLFPQKLLGTQADMKEQWNKRIDIVEDIFADISNRLDITGEIKGLYKDICLATEKALIDISQNIYDIINGEEE